MAKYRMGSSILAWVMICPWWLDQQMRSLNHGFRMNKPQSEGVNAISISLGIWDDGICYDIRHGSWSPFVSFVLFSKK